MWHPPTLESALATGYTTTLGSKEGHKGLIYLCSCGEYFHPLMMRDMRATNLNADEFICAGCVEEMARQLLNVDGTGNPASVAEFKARYVALHNAPADIISTVGTEHQTVENLELERVSLINNKALNAITTLANAHVRIDMVARGVIELAKALIAKGVITVNDLPPRAVELAALWDDQIDVINEARDAAIADGTLVDDFNP